MLKHYNAFLYNCDNKQKLCRSEGEIIRQKVKIIIIGNEEVIHFDYYILY